MLLVVVLAGTMMRAGGVREAAAVEDTPVVRFERDGIVTLLNVEVADTPELTICGLMHRPFLPDDQGMLFVYESRYGFWNRNTLIPLSVAYLDADGKIVDILDMEATAYAGAPGVVQPDPRAPYSYVIEVNRGWFARHGIAIGDVAELNSAVARGSAGQPPPLCRDLGT